MKQGGKFSSCIDTLQSQSWPLSLTGHETPEFHIFAPSFLSVESSKYVDLLTALSIQVVLFTGYL